jgi:hypothetical protein
VISRFQSFDAGSTLDDFAAAFVTQYAGKRTFRILPRQGEGIGVTDTTGNHLE